jgi:dihydroorotate dehydrogenase
MKNKSPKFFISAPFGNYIKPKGCIPVAGTFTLNARGNRLWSVLKTLRYNSAQSGWVNRLGLPNPGIRNGLEKNPTVISIAEIDKGDFQRLNVLIPENQSIELNLSCPNLDKKLSWESAKCFTPNTRKWCIAKMSPLTTPEEIKFVVEHLGITQLHFSNTLPTIRGGLSGPMLRGYTTELIELARSEYGDSVEIIAGGGVSDFGSVTDYLSSGANHISLGSVCFNPFKLRKLLRSLEL